jgi:uncharacterized protein (DUF2249 family)
MSDDVVTLDVREDIRGGRDPFSRIMQAVAQLRRDQKLRIVAPFEPRPLMSLLGQRGFTCQSTPRDNGDWEVLFQSGGQAPAPPRAEAAQSSSCACAGPAVVEVDARGLEPPQPMIRILETLAALPEGAELRARTDRRPLHLFPHLEERGFVGQSEEQTDGSYLTRIRRK